MASIAQTITTRRRKNFVQNVDGIIITSLPVQDSSDGHHYHVQVVEEIYTTTQKNVMKTPEKTNKCHC